MAIRARGARTGLAVLITAASALVAADPAESHRDVVIDAPLAVARLEGAGLDLGSVAFVHKAKNNAELATLAGWQGLTAAVAEAATAARRRDPRLGVGLRFGHRLFDLGWLRSAEAAMTLVAVANRLDRADLGGEGCGETRLIYRLEYHAGGAASRLPMTVNVVFSQPGTCFEAWKRWPWEANRHPDALLAADGALAPAMRAPANLIAVEVNLQLVRWPSTAKPDLGGHAEYLMLVLRPDPSGRLRAVELENQPDVGRLQRDPRLLRRLLAWLQEPDQVAAIVRGTLLLPREFLARSAVSIAPRGLARLGNRPFRTLFAADAFATIPAAALGPLQNAHGLLRRLDTLSCTGCHQANSIAGFHLLGREERRQFGLLAVGRSPHLQREIALRQADMDRWPEMPQARSREAPDLLDAGLPDGPCGLVAGTAPACVDLPTARLRCVQLDDDELGVCLPEAGDIGGACEAGILRSGPRPERDSMSHVTTLPCPVGAVCNASKAGFPAGLCVGACDNPPDGTTCTGIPRLTPFNQCLARGKPFVACAADHAFAALVRGCSDELPCRGDFACSRGPGGQGACMPPYFLPELRVDGHPSIR